MLQKLYITAIFVLFGIGGLLFTTLLGITVHDAWTYWSLPESYRAAIGKLEDGWLYAGLPPDESAAILDMHQKWESEEKLPWWGADTLVDLDDQRRETLSNFRKLVPLWGCRYSQRFPMVTILVSLGVFMPGLLLIAAVRWYRWIGSAPTLRTPES